jgi:hypothetical protein
MKSAGQIHEMRRAVGVTALKLLIGDIGLSRDQPRDADCGQHQRKNDRD